MILKTIDDILPCDFMRVEGESEKVIYCLYSKECDHQKEYAGKEGKYCERKLRR